MILVAGGSLDPHVHHVLDELRRRKLPHQALLVGPHHHPRLSLDLDGRLELDGTRVQARALWLRHDVFAALADPRAAVQRRALAWYNTLAAWAAMHPEVRMVNRTFLGRSNNKLDVLARARRLGLRVPETWVSNDPEALGEADPSTRVAKPVSGGSLCLPLAQALGSATLQGGVLASPAIVQERLVAPELRVYRVGDRLIGFEMRSDHLDYRDDDDSEVLVHPGPPPAVGSALMALSGELGLELCAADLKTCPNTGELVFLELNSQPMFDAHEVVSGGALSAAIVDLLL